MASKDDCEICCERKMVFKCGALNNCDKKVCDDCFYKNPTCEYEGYTKKCMFCFRYDIKRDLVSEFQDRLYNEMCPPDKVDLLINRHNNRYSCDGTEECDCEECLECLECDEE